MNVFCYNISGGDAPDHKHMRKDAQVPGYKTAETMIMIGLKMRLNKNFY